MKKFKVTPDSVISGDSRKVLAQMPDNVVDAVVCDPPYEMGFMGRAWDKTGIAYSVGLWKETLRVLKPGGHLLACGGTRTYHRMACAIEDAGFDIRDQIQWMYGKGFPKSMDISKQFDKHAGNERPVVGKYQPPGMEKDWNLKNAKDEREVKVFASSRNNLDITAPVSEEARQWEGWGTALKPAHEPICLARKPLSEKTVIQNILKWGVGALNIDAVRISLGGEKIKIGFEKGDYEKSNSGWIRPWRQDVARWKDYKEKSVEESNRKGRWPANIVLSHHADCVRIGVRRVKNGSGGITGNEPSSVFKDGMCYGNMDGRTSFDAYGDADGMETVENWACISGCPIRTLDEQSGVSQSAGGRSYQNTNQMYAGGWAADNGSKMDPGFGDIGGASRFFYTAKANNAERWMYCARCEDAYRIEKKADHIHSQKNHDHLVFHPTQKPVSLITWLCRMVVPPGGVVLDHFAGSGTTAVVAKALGLRWVSIDRTPEYCVMTSRRLETADEDIALFSKEEHKVVLHDSAEPVMQTDLFKGETEPK